MSKNKKLVNFTISKKVADDFSILAKNNCINKSQLIEKFISNWLKDIIENEKK